ncbi:MAG: adenosylmethionine--8-amino-7-oxononanoate transaminase [Mariprofundaceae bacterium]|nr:adenosylmethionine--8-amino-7-oxononanoate transaminase [Mariprofundaceae bacterium]
MKGNPDWLTFERQHVWHPYASMQSPPPVYPVTRAKGVYLQLEDGRELIDGMASWWSAIHGYGVPALDAAIHGQLKNMAHVMFGGLTHKPAAALAERLLAFSPPSLQHVFFSDSGSVAIEVAIKIALQYWQAKGESNKRRLLTIRHGYHGDTFGAMGVCDPIHGMHHVFESMLPKHLFADAPNTEAWHAQQIVPLRKMIESHHQEIAAFIIEPIVQGAGGMRFYSPRFLAQAHALCHDYNVLFIADEIATGFGRTGRMFAVEHASIEPDIMCVGKALTGGYMSLAATLCSTKVCHGLHGTEEHGAGVLMHGPTFMANPLACAVACASIDLLCASPWQERIVAIAAQLQALLMPYKQHPKVADVRVLGAIGVIEMKEAVDVARVQRLLVAEGVWLRPFGKLIYTMPPYIINHEQLQRIVTAIGKTI